MPQNKYLRIPAVHHRDETRIDNKAGYNIASYAIVHSSPQSVLQITPIKPNGVTAIPIRLHFSYY